MQQGRPALPGPTSPLLERIRRGIIGMGASIGREAAPKLLGGASARPLARIPRGDRPRLRLSVAAPACGLSG
jgi:H+/Cl- antiporter ClcA